MTNSTLSSPLISVLTVVRNGASCIEQTIRSVLSQNYPRIEYIIVDGASTDGTQDIVQRFRSDIDQFVSEPDSGISDGFNKAMQMASGDAVLYMNAGDAFDSPDSISVLVAGIPAGVTLRDSIVYGDATIVSPNVARRQYTDHRLLTLSKETSICHQSVLIGIVPQRRFLYDGRLALKMDLDFWLRCHSKGVPFYKVDASICRYLAGGVSDHPKSMVPSAFEDALVRMLNDKKQRTIATITSLLVDVLRARMKRRVRSLLGERRYVAIKVASRQAFLKRYQS